MNSTSTANVTIKSGVNHIYVLHFCSLSFQHTMVENIIHLLMLTMKLCSIFYYGKCILVGNKLLIDWLINRSIDWLIYRLIDWFVDWLKLYLPYCHHNHVIQLPSRHTPMFSITSSFYHQIVHLPSRVVVGCIGSSLARRWRAGDADVGIFHTCSTAWLRKTNKSTGYIKSIQFTNLDVFHLPGLLYTAT